jgi:hypothetical protein
MDWLHLVTLLAPALLAAAHVPPALIGPIATGIQEAQHIFGAKNGADKKAHVLNIAAATMQAVNAQKGREVLPVEETTDLVSKGIDTTIGAINFVHTLHGAH